MKREVRFDLAASVRELHRETLVFQDAPVLTMGEDAAKELGFSVCLRSIRVIYNQTYRLVVICLCLFVDLPEQLQVHRIE